MPTEGRGCSSSPAPPFSLTRFPETTNGDRKIVTLDKALSAPATFDTSSSSNARKRREAAPSGLSRPKPVSSQGSAPPDTEHIKIPEDGVYLIVLKVTAQNLNERFDAVVDVEIKNTYGYLSAIELPLLHFYGIMCIFYGEETVP